MVVRLITTIFVCIAVLSCESKRGKQQSGTSDDVMGIDSCDACSINSFFVRQASALGEEKTSIRKPVAIQFFNQVRLADKYERSVPYDTLEKMLKVKNTGYMQAVYTLKDQYFYFKEVIEPILIKNSINVIDSVSADRLLEFQGTEGSFVVSPTDYQDQDGVLFFTPGRDRCSGQ